MRSYHKAVTRRLALVLLLGLVAAGSAAMYQAAAHERTYRALLAQGDTALRDELNTILQRKHAEIEAILDQYGVPRVPEPPQQQLATK